MCIVPTRCDADGTLMALLVCHDASTCGLAHSICHRTTRPSDLNSLGAGRAELDPNEPNRTQPDWTDAIQYSDGTRLDSTAGLTRPDPTWPPLLLLGASSTSRPRRHTVAMAISMYVRHRSSAHTPTRQHPPPRCLMACRTQAKQTNRSIHQLTRLRIVSYRIVSFAHDHTSSLLGVLWPPLNSQHHEPAAFLSFRSPRKRSPRKHRSRCSTLTCCFS